MSRTVWVPCDIPVVWTANATDTHPTRSHWKCACGSHSRRGFVSEEDAARSAEGHVRRTRKAARDAWREPVAA